MKWSKPYCNVRARRRVRLTFALICALGIGPRAKSPIDCMASDSKTFFFLRFDDKLRPDVTEALVPHFIDRPVLLKTEGALITLFNSHSTHSEVNAALTALRPHILFFLIEITQANMAFGLGAETANWLASYIEHLHPSDGLEEGEVPELPFDPFKAEDDEDEDEHDSSSMSDIFGEDDDEDEDGDPILRKHKAPAGPVEPTLDELLDKLNDAGGFMKMTPHDRALLRKLAGGKQDL